MFARLAVNLPAVSGVFDYAIPPELLGVGVGSLVTAPFGNQTVQGVVLELVDEASVAETKPLESLLDPVPVLSVPQMELAKWMSAHYLQPLAAMIGMMLPVGLSQQADTQFSVISDPPSGTSQSSVISVGEFLPLRPRGLITLITIPLNAKFAFEYVARTPSDKPIVCAALAQWTGARARLAVGGWGKSPSLAMDGTEAEGIESAARNACHEATDEWGSAEYRMDVASTLAKRCLEAVK